MEVVNYTHLLKSKYETKSFKSTCHWYFLNDSIFLTVTVINLYTGKQCGNDGQSSRGYYMNEGLGPTQSSMNLVGSHDIDTESERSSRQYATVDSNQRLADLMANMQESGADRTSSTYSSSVSQSAVENDVPSASLRPNVAYGIEQQKIQQNGGGYVNGRRTPMRPPPRPPR